MASLKHFAILLLPVQLVYWFVLAVTSTTSHAQLGSIIGVVGGSALIDNAGDEFEKSVASAKAAAESLSDRVNGHARDRLDQIDLIVNRTGAALIGRSEDAALTILREASDELETLEEKAFADAKALIWEFECAGKRLTRDDVRHVFGKFGNWLSLYEFEIAPPVKVRKAQPWYSGCFFLCSDPYVVEVKENFDETYKIVKLLMEESISPQVVTDQTPAHDILAVYSYMTGFARSASCSYPGAAEEWVRESIRYSEKVKQWQNILDVQIK